MGITKDLDLTDRLILTELQKEGRLSNVELARRVHLSATPCLERVKRLENDGIIKGYSAHLEPKFLNAELLVFVEITLQRNSPDIFAEFKRAVINLPEIMECHLVSGNFDYLIKSRVADMAAYRALLGETLLNLPGVSDSRTYVVMEELKESSMLIIPRK